MSKKQLDPMELFNLIKYVPSLFTAFREECYAAPEQKTLEDIPEKKYDHKLGIAFLEKHGIPTTHEDLYEDGKFFFESVMTGSVRYNVGQMVVIFSEAIQGSAGIGTHNTWIMEVMDEFEFPGNVTLVSLKIEDIRLALKEHLDRGVIKLYPAAGIRMYDVEKTFGFAERINKEESGDEKPV